MERRMALTVAGTAAIVLVSGLAAMAANLGILDIAGASSDEVGDLDAQNVAELVDPVGTTSSSTTALGPQVVYVDQYDIPPAPEGSAASQEGGSGASAAADDGQCSDGPYPDDDDLDDDLDDQMDADHDDDHGDDHDDD